jgi:hypothetical protein
MRLEEITDDPIGDLIKQKTSADPLDQLVNKFMQADQPEEPKTPAPAVATVQKPQVKGTADKVAVQPARPAPQPRVQPIIQAAGSLPGTQVRDYLASKGLSKQHVIGMLANIEHESQFKPQTLVTDSNGLPSGGLFQHNGPRLQSLVNKLGKTWNQNWKGQIDYALSEPDGQRYTGIKFKDPNQAAKWWTLNFERPANKQKVAQTRARTATKYQLAQKTR